MKAISIRQPWAGLIATRIKTIETRTWKTNFRGDILICASLKHQAHVGHLADRHLLTSNVNFEYGKAICVASLIDIHWMDWREESAACLPVYEGAYSWVLDNIRPIKPFQVKGRLGLFEVDDSLIQIINNL